MSDFSLFNVLGQINLHQYFNLLMPRLKLPFHMHWVSAQSLSREVFRWLNYC